MDINEGCLHLWTRKRWWWWWEFCLLQRTGGCCGLKEIWKSGSSSRGRICSRRNTLQSTGGLLKRLVLEVFQIQQSLLSGICPSDLPDAALPPSLPCTPPSFPPCVPAKNTVQTTQPVEPVSSPHPPRASRPLRLHSGG